MIEKQEPFAVRSISRIKRHGINIKRWTGILLGGMPARGKVSVSYGFDHIPRANEIVRGGIIKFQRIQDLFPSSPRNFNLLYLGSSSLPKDSKELLWLARRKGARIIYNQNGVAYCGWHGPGWERANAPMAKVLHAADYVFYQSRFCKRSADHFLGERQGPWEILYNAVDTNFFTPPQTNSNSEELVLLVGGEQYLYYALETALQTLAIINQERNNVKMLITGRMTWIRDQTKATQIAQKLVNDLNLVDKVTFLGPYTQRDAPTIFRMAHLLLHTKYNDPCPSGVIEAMACGLPVVYSCSGGTPELVGNDAGIGIPAELSWERVYPPDPRELARATLQMAEKRKQYAEAARQRAVENFDLKKWLQRHEDVFGRLSAKMS